MGIKMFNINSPCNVNDDTLDFVLNNSGFLNSLARSVPIYLVDKELMDVICPPQIWPQLKPDCVQEMINSFDEEYGVQVMPESIENQRTRQQPGDPELIANAAERFWESVRQKAQGSHAVSFKAAYRQTLDPGEVEEIERRIRIRIPFTRHLGENRQSSIGELKGVPTLEDMAYCRKIYGHLGKLTSDPMLAGFQSILEEHQRVIPRREVVFICMERIVQAASRIKEIPDFKSLDMNILTEIIFSAYLLYQLAHGYMKTELVGYHTPWVRVMEKGLVAAYTMSCFKDEQSRAVFRAHLSRQPFEYKGFTYFERFSQSDLQYLLRAWSCNHMRDGHELSEFRHPSLQHPHVDYLNSSSFSNQPEKFWQTLAIETLREATAR